MPRHLKQALISSKMSDECQKSRRGRPRKMTSEAMLDVAMKAYWTDDPVDVSVNAICQQAGVSKPSLYRCFGSEDGLTCAALDRYAEQILSDVFAILQSGMAMQETLNALMDFVIADPRMETGCLFYKMRTGKHRLGPITRARVDEINAAAKAGFEAFLRARREAGEWNGKLSVKDGGIYLSEQIALAFTQRASGVDPNQIRKLLHLALSVFDETDG